MKRNLLLAIPLCLLLSFAQAQTFYVEKTEKGHELKVIDKLKYEGYKLADQKELSDYTIDCLLDGQYSAWKIGNMFHGYVKITDTKTGNEIARTKEVGKSPSMYNGFQAGPKIMAVIADKYLIPELKKITSNYKKQSL